MRQKLYWLITISIFLSAHGSYCDTPAEVKGYVYEDTNRNRQFDRGEKGIANVLVTNQLEITKTDTLGHYALPLHDKHTTIFVIKPADYMIPVNELNQPQFFYYYQPEGSPKQKFPGLEPTGELPSSVDFALYPAPSESVFDMAAISDPQMQNTDEVNYLRDDVVPELVGTKASFGIVLGDIGYDNLAVYEKVKPVLATVGIPLFAIPGNHDENYDAPDDQDSLETFKRNFAPSYYAFEYGKVSFIVLDSVEWRINPETKKGSYIGRLGEKQLQWIRNYISQLPEDRLIVFTMHIPLFYSLNKSESLNITNRDQLFEIVKNHPHLLAIAGHMHCIDQVNMGKQIGRDSDTPFPMITCAAACGAWWSGPKDIEGIPESLGEDGSPNGYHIFHFRGNQFTQEFKPARMDKTYQMRISSPKGILSSSDLSKKEVVVNIFNASEQSIVEFTIDKGNPVRLTRQSRQDPFLVSYYEKYKSSLPQDSSAAVSSHIWVSPMPSPLAAGLHTLIVKVVDQYGYQYQQSVIFEIE